jgi:hypothetical protein
MSAKSSLLCPPSYNDEDCGSTYSGSDIDDDGLVLSKQHSHIPEEDEELLKTLDGNARHEISSINQDPSLPPSSRTVPVMTLYETKTVTVMQTHLSVAGLTTATTATLITATNFLLVQNSEPLNSNLFKELFIVLTSILFLSIISLGGYIFYMHKNYRKKVRFNDCNRDRRNSIIKTFTDSETGEND